MTTTNTASVERGMVKLYVLHQGKRIAFAYPSIGPNDYRSVGAEILKRNQNVPTGDHTASLIYSAYCDSRVQNEPEFENVKKIMNNSWLWVYNNDLWTLKGVYVVPDLKALGRSQPLNENELEKMLKGGKDINGIRFSKDKNKIVRFAPKGSYRLGEHNSESFAKDGFMIASCGQEGAEKLGEASTKFKNKMPYIHGLEIKEGQSPEQRVSSLGELFGDRLHFGGYSFVDIDYCRAFGVLK